MTWLQALTRRALLSTLPALLTPFVFRGSSEAEPDFDIASEPPPSHSIEERLSAILAGKTPKLERVTLAMPPHAEDGGTVPMQLDVESPMTERDHVRHIYIVADQNPDPLVFSAGVHPGIGQVRWKLNIRLAGNSRVRAIAEMSNGELYAHEVFVEVLVGGCG